MADDPATLRGRRVLVIGLGLQGGGVAAARWLARSGAKVTVTDLRDRATLAPSIAALTGLPLRWRLGGQWPDDVAEADLVVANPAVPDDSPLLAMAKARGVPVTTELGLFVTACPSRRVVGVTGSNGKSTTTAMIAAMLEASGRRTWCGGNIGHSLLEDLPAIGRDDAVVLEISSFQLDLLRPFRWSPRVAVFTTFTPNHLDRHGSMPAYLDAKRQIWRHQRRDEVAVLGADDPQVAALAAEPPGAVWLARTAGGLPPLGVGVVDGRASAVQPGRTTPLFTADDVPLPGRHNLSNACMAAAAALAAGATPEGVATGLRGFRGLPHRLELVATRAGVRFYNDSIATNPESVYAALDALAGPIQWIGGGAGKGLDLAPLSHALVSRVEACHLIGRMAPELDALLRAARGGRPAPTLASHATLEHAVAAAAAAARAGGVVLLSPACASFDMFANFQARGDAFRRAVLALADRDAA